MLQWFFLFFAVVVVECSRCFGGGCGRKKRRKKKQQNQIAEEFLLLLFATWIPPLFCVWISCNNGDEEKVDDDVDSRVDSWLCAVYISPLARLAGCPRHPRSSFRHRRVTLTHSKKTGRATHSHRYTHHTLTNTHLANSVSLIRWRGNDERVKQNKIKKK